jgi:hypothetical protein
MTDIERLEHVEQLLDLIGDIDPTNPFEVALLNERDDLRSVIREDQCGQGIDPETLTAEEFDALVGFEASMRRKYPVLTQTQKDAQ